MTEEQRAAAKVIEDGVRKLQRIADLHGLSMASYLLDAVLIEVERIGKPRAADLH